MEIYNLVGGSGGNGATAAIPYIWHNTGTAPTSGQANCQPGAQLSLSNFDANGGDVSAVFGELTTYPRNSLYVVQADNPSKFYMMISGPPGNAGSYYIFPRINDSQGPFPVDGSTVYLFLSPGGLNGSQGDQGFQGVQGFQGDVGTMGNTGAQGFQGDVGPQGPQGFQGDPGAPGMMMSMNVAADDMGLVLVPSPPTTGRCALQSVDGGMVWVAL